MAFLISIMIKVSVSIDVLKQQYRSDLNVQKSKLQM